MSDPYVGEIRITAINFEPYGWFYCDGRQLVCNQYPQLYAVIGNIYGGTQGQNFNLPNLKANAPMGQGAGPGLTNRTLGKGVGAQQITLTQDNMIPHSHTVQATSQKADSADPTNRYWAKLQGITAYSTANDKLVTMNPAALSVAGSSPPAAHNNMQPLLGINFIIAWQGEFPIRP